jgi:hypothetical protein
MQGTFKEHSKNVQGAFREHQGGREALTTAERKRVWVMAKANIQGPFSEHKGTIEGQLREHSV